MPMNAAKLTRISALIIMGVVSDWYCAYEWFQEEYPFYSAQVLTRMLLIVLACAAIGAMVAIYRGKPWVTAVGMFSYSSVLVTGNMIMWWISHKGLSRMK
jgi:hypothetical protein